MGCGKSSVGRELSKLLCCPFMDLDSVIEEKEGRTIPEIFASDGEAAFRCMEVEALHSIVVHPVDSVGPLPASWAPPPSRGWQNANSIHQGDTPRPPHILQESDEDILQSGDHLTPDVNCDAVVLALGGGTVMTPDCAEMVHENTLCIYLRASVDTLVRNLSGEAEGRPMLSQASSRGAERRGDLQDRIEELMALRSATYEKTAHIMIDTDGRSVAEIASEIFSVLK